MKKIAKKLAFAVLEYSGLPLPETGDILNCLEKINTLLQAHGQLFFSSYQELSACFFGGYFFNNFLLSEIFFLNSSDGLSKVHLQKR
jgi:hypothetical protein